MAVTPTSENLSTARLLSTKRILLPLIQVNVMDFGQLQAEVMDSPLESLATSQLAPEVLLDRTGLMDSSGAIDRGDELFRGRGAKIAVLDFSFWRGHEDLERIELNSKGAPVLDANDEPIPTVSWSRDTQGRYFPRKPYVIVEKDVTMITIPSVGYPDHGTAVLGQLSALDEARDWGEEAQGITGIVPEAQPYFYPLVTREDGPRELTAWFKAVLELGPGDVICAAYDPAGIFTSCAENEAVVTISQLAAQQGIVSAVAAGNGRQECISAGGGAEDGMIIVGGVTPAGPGQAHRQAESNYGESVDSAAWGDYVVSTGYGDLFSALQDQYPSDLGTNRRRSYTARFGGTSAAAAQIAGSVCALQGLAKQFFGIPANPTGLRDIAMVPFPAEGAPNTEAVIFDNSARQNFPAVSGILGSDVDGDGRLDGVYEALGGESGDIDVALGTYPRIWRFADNSSAVNQLLTLDGAVIDNEAINLISIYPIQGEFFGNIYSAKGEDGALLNATSEFALGSEGLSGLPPASILDQGPRAGDIVSLLRDAVRPVTGEVTDLALEHRVTTDPRQLSSIEATVSLRAPVTPVLVVGMSLWDYRLNRWQVADVDLVTAEDDVDPVTGNVTLEFELPVGFGFAQRYVSRQRNWTRIWTLGFGDVIGDLPNYSVFYDLINVQFVTPGDNDGP